MDMVVLVGGKEGEREREEEYGSAAPRKRKGKIVVVLCGTELKKEKNAPPG
jgi:hypothetical protein